MTVPWIFEHHGEIMEPARTLYVRLHLHAFRARDNSRTALRRVGDRPVDDGGRAEPSRVARTNGHYLVVVWPIDNLVQVQTRLISRSQGRMGHTNEGSAMARMKNDASKSGMARLGRAMAGVSGSQGLRGGYVLR